MKILTLDSSLFADHVLSTSSRVEALLRGHLWIEHYLTELLREKLVRPDAVDIERMAWRQKLSWCDGLGLIEQEDIPSLLEFNRIRNRLAHDLNAEPTEQQVIALIGASSPRMTATLSALQAVARRGRQDGLARRSWFEDLQIWIVVTVIGLEYRWRRDVYARAHDTALKAAPIIQFILERERGESISYEEALSRQGVPPAPEFSEWFWPGARQRRSSAVPSAGSTDRRGA